MARGRLDASDVYFRALLAIARAEAIILRHMTGMVYVSRQHAVAGPLLIRRLGIGQRNAPCMIARTRQEWFFSWFHSPAAVRDRMGWQQARAGDFIMWAPGERQHFGERSRRWSNSWLALDGPRAASRLRGFPANQLLQLDDQEASRFTLQAVHHELAHFQMPNPGIIGNLIENLVFALERQLGRSRLAALPPPMRVAWNALCAGYGNSGCSIEALAGQSGMSRSAFTRSFRRHFGCPPLDALLRLRLDRAQELLGDAHTGIDAVARSCGFGNHRYFARVVRCRFGCSPRELRERLLLRARSEQEARSEMS
jgi:AraC-like DNA-binding protein